MSLDQFLEAGVRNMLQNFRQHGMVVGHGVAPVSAPDRRKRPECEESQRRAPDQANSVPDSRGSSPGMTIRELYDEDRFGLRHTFPFSRRPQPRFSIRSTKRWNR